MTKKRFTILYETEENPMEWDLIDNQKDCLIVTGNGTTICELLNELHEENYILKKKNKYLEEYNNKLLKFIKETAEYSRKEKELEERERQIKKEKDCGTCKHLQIDGMFGMWCDLDKDWTNIKYCSYWER